MTDNVVLRTFSNEAEARIAAAALEAHGVPSHIQADNAGGALPAMSVLFPIRLIVRRDDAEFAATILEGVTGAEEDDADQSP